MKIFVKEGEGGVGGGVVGGVACTCFLEMGRWAKQFLLFLICCIFLWAGQDDGVVMIFGGGGRPPFLSY